MNTWNLFDRPEMMTFGWVILHSLWQGAIVAALVGGLRMVMPRSAAKARYAVACAGLLVMLAAPVTTFFYLDNGPVSQLAITGESTGVSLIPSQPISTAPGLIV